MGSSLSAIEQEALILDHQEFAKKLANAVVNSQRLTIEYEEAQSCALVGLVDAAQRYDPTRSVSFKSFAYRRIAGEIIDHCRRNSFVRRRGLEKGIKYEVVSANTGWEDDSEFAILPAIQVDVDLKLDFEVALEILTDREKRVVLALAAGARGREVAADLGVTESRVSQIASEARAKLERRMSSGS